MTGCTISNGSEHEISVFKGPNDTQQVGYNYVNDEHLKQVTSGGNTYSLYYDALGRCVKRTLNSTTTYYIYDGEKPILDYKSSDLTNPAKNVYGKGIDEILMRTDPTVNSGNAVLLLPGPRRKCHASLNAQRQYDRELSLRCLRRAELLQRFGNANHFYRLQQPFPVHRKRIRRDLPEDVRRRHLTSTNTAPAPIIRP